MGRRWGVVDACWWVCQLSDLVGDCSDGVWFQSLRKIAVAANRERRRQDTRRVRRTKMMARWWVWLRDVQGAMQ